MNTFTNSFIKFSILSALLVAVLAVNLLRAWDGPPGSPPDCPDGYPGCDAPISTGAVDQIKNAGLGVDSLAVYNNALVVGSMTASAFLYSSDERLKKNVQTSPGLEIVSQLRGVSFDWRKSGKPSYGVVAQEVEEVLPELVSTDSLGYKTVEYANLIAPLIEAIKEQQQQIEVLQAQVDALQ